MFIIKSSSAQSPSTKKKRAGYFTRSELNLILNTYSLRVAAGDWRDYALDHLEELALFSIYRSRLETPIYTIEKKRLKGIERWQYSLHDRRRLLKTSQQIDAILTYLNSLPRLVRS